MICFEHDPPKLISPIWVSMRGADDNSIPDCLYDQSAPYEQDVRRILHSLHSDEFPNTDLMTYFVLPDDPEMEAVIRSKIHAAPLSIQAIGNTLYAVVEPELSAELSETELQIFVNQLEYQFQDGWGAEFEVTQVLTPQGDKEVIARLCREGISVYSMDQYLELTQTDNHAGQMNMNF